MTTILVVRKNGRATIAADTLARYGNTREDARLLVNSDKIIGVGDAWLCPAGPASAQLVLRSYFSDPEAPASFDGVQEIFETMRELQSSLKDDYHLNPKEDESDPFDSMQMEMLVASPAGIFGVYPLRSVQEYSSYYAFGSGADFALGALHAWYDRLDSTEDIALRAMEAAARFDDATALPLTMRSVPLTPR